MRRIIGIGFFYVFCTVMGILIGLGCYKFYGHLWEWIDSNGVEEVQAQVEQMEPIRVTTTPPDDIVKPDELRVTDDEATEKALGFSPQSAITFYVQEKPVIEFTTDNHILWYRGDKVITIDNETMMVRALRCYMTKLANVGDLSQCHCPDSEKESPGTDNFE